MGKCVRKQLPRKKESQVRGKKLCEIRGTCNFSPRSGVSKLIFTGGHISLTVAFKGLNVILGLNKYNYSLTRAKELSSAAG